MSKDRRNLILFHTVCWLCVILPSLLQVHSHGQNATQLNLLRMVLPLNMIVLFYVNYLWLVPTYYLTNKKQPFFTINLLLLAVLLVIAYFTSNEFIRQNSCLNATLHKATTYQLRYLLQCAITLAFTVMVATLLCMSLRWQYSEQARHEAERQKAVAELKHLRMQIGPHFLLNTLNNIYALIAFDQTKAQKAVKSLGEMLQMMLYDNQDLYVDLKKLASFITDYTELMKLRMPANVKVSLDFDLPQESQQIRIAHHIIISLVENAFKHGVSASAESFISIRIQATTQQIVCRVVNSYHPQKTSLSSDHGIGLEQVQQRLDLCYPGKYTWEKGVNDKHHTYESTITVYDTKMLYHR